MRVPMKRWGTGDDLKGLIEKHVLYTNSKLGEKLLANWDSSLKHFVRVMPTEYKKALERLAKGEVIVEELETA